MGWGSSQGPRAGVFTLELGHVVGGNERVPPSTLQVPSLGPASGQLQGTCGEQAAFAWLDWWA